MLGQALGAQPAAVDRVVGVALHRHGPAVAHADQHAAAHRAVAAGRAHPVVGRPALRYRPAARLGDVAVAVAAVVGAETCRTAARAARLTGALPAAPRQNAPGMFSGTTVT